MKPTEVRNKVRRLKEKLKLDKIMIKNYERDRDTENYQERIAKQRAIILEAEQSVAKIRHQRKTALRKIAKVKQSSRYTAKQLVMLKNYKTIEQFKKVIAELVATRKETEDGEADSDT